jgi:hypothetical protein
VSGGKRQCAKTESSAIRLCILILFVIVHIRSFCLNVSICRKLHVLMIDGLNSYAELLHQRNVWP